MWKFSFLLHFFIWEDSRYFKSSNLPFVSCWCNSKEIFEKNVIIFFIIKDDNLKKFLINSYNLIIPATKGNILFTKNSLDEIVICIIAIDNVEKTLIFIGL